MSWTDEDERSVLVIPYPAADPPFAMIHVTHRKKRGGWIVHILGRRICQPGPGYRARVWNDREDAKKAALSILRATAKSWKETADLWLGICDP